MNCLEATDLMSQSMDAPIGISNRVKLRGHLFVCVHCRQFRTQLSVLRSASHQWAHGPVPGQASAKNNNDKNNNPDTQGSM